jgi:Transposase
LKREAFFLQQARYQGVNAGLFGRKMPTYADFGGWVISTFAGWFVVTSDTQAQIARELGVSQYSLTLWKKDYLRHLRPAQLDGEQMGPEEMLEKIRQLQKENEYLKRQREILKKAMSILGEEPHSGMR